MKRFFFSKNLRLLHSSDFQFVFQNPKCVRSAQIIALGRFNRFKYPRIGISIAKKRVKLAHERNRIRRLIKESFRLYQYKLPLMDFVIIVKKGTINLNNDILLNVLEKLWLRHCHTA
ncbi:MAG: ribonuclease P protein component [Pantoea sp. Brub]|nr:ribonuclease P protein component [Pantoea sp. Brub]